VLLREGLPGVLSRVKERLPYYGAYVLVYRVPEESAGALLPASRGAGVAAALERARRVLGDLEFKELTAADQAGVSALTAVDPFNANEKLADGWRCFVAILRGKTVASYWTKCGPEFHEPFMDRPLRLADGEVYNWRSFCVPERRGVGLAPMLGHYVRKRLASEEGLHTHIGWVATNNHAQLGTLKKTGFRVVGRIGFFDAFGYRLHYLVGRDALRATTRRVFVQRRSSAA
jgi:GNAT superfamily N-acetyltransferase